MSAKTDDQLSLLFMCSQLLPTGGEEMQTSVPAPNVPHVLTQLLNAVFLSLAAYSTRSAHEPWRKPQLLLDMISTFVCCAWYLDLVVHIDRLMPNSTSFCSCLQCLWNELFLANIFFIVIQKYLMQIKYLIKMSPLILFQEMH